jgi:hypothetical protein
MTEPAPNITFDLENNYVWIDCDGELVIERGLDKPRFYSILDYHDGFER